MKYAVALFVLAIGMMACIAPAFADDAFATFTFSGDFDLVQNQTTEHNDLEPFKGWANFTVNNSTDEDWTDFHFRIIPAYGIQGTPTTIFVEGIVDGINCTPISSQGGLTWSIGSGGQEMNLFFTDKVESGTSASFTVYTDNRTWRQRFGIEVYPTAVPEPGSMLALCSGMVGLLGFALRKRS